MDPELLQNIGIATGQLVAGAVAGQAIRLGRNYVVRRVPARSIWSVNKASPVHLVTAQDENDFQDEFTAKVYPAEYLAAVEVRTLLRSTHDFTDITLCPSSEFTMGKLLQDNLVSVGGPVHNRLTRVLLERIQLPVDFDGFTAVSSESGNRYDARIDEAGSIVRDFGIVAIAANPFRDDTLAVLLMGCRTFGCAAAAEYVTKGRLRQVSTTLGESLPKWALVEADVVDGFVARISLLESSGS